MNVDTAKRKDAIASQDTTHSLEGMALYSTMTFSEPDVETMMRRRKGIVRSFLKKVVSRNICLPICLFVI